MSKLDERIARFENMATADPENEMAHFSLGQAYLEAGRSAEAAASLERCLSLAPEMSKAWQLAGEAMIKAGWEDKAAATLRRGYEVAAAKGDVAPRDAIAGLLERLGVALPQVAPARGAATCDRTAAGPRSGGFVCKRTGRPGMQLAEPPMRGPVGRWIMENISAETWRTWIGQGTKVINELRLDLSRPEDQRVFDEQMHEFLGIDAEVLEEIGAGGAPTA